RPRRLVSRRSTSTINNPVDNPAVAATAIGVCSTSVGSDCRSPTSTRAGESTKKVVRLSTQRPWGPSTPVRPTTQPTPIRAETMKNPARTPLTAEGDAGFGSFAPPQIPGGGGARQSDLRGGARARPGGVPTAPGPGPGGGRP